MTKFDKQISLRLVSKFEISISEFFGVDLMLGRETGNTSLYPLGLRHEPLHTTRLKIFVVVIQIYSRCHSKRRIEGVPPSLGTFQFDTDHVCYFQEKKRVERGNSSDSLLSTDAESESAARTPYEPGLQHLLKGHTGGELTDDIVDAIVKSPIKVRNKYNIKI